MENNDFEIFNANDSINNSIDFNIGNELNNISYVNDDNQIVEPIEVNAVPQITVNPAGNVTSVIFTEDTKEETENKKSMPQFIFDENGMVTNVIYNEEPIIGPNEEVKNVNSKFTFDENGAVTAVSFVDKEKENKVVKTPKFTFENGVVTSVSLEEAPKNSRVKAVPKIEFDENGIVIADHESDNLVEEIKEDSPIVEKSELDILIDDINANREKINNEFARLNNIIKMATEAGIADSQYLKDTFEKIAIFNSVNDKFNIDADNYIASLKNTDTVIPLSAIEEQ